MQVATHTEQSPVEQAIPADLRAWMSEDQLVRLALEAVQAVSWEDRGEIGRATPWSRRSEPVMLTLMTYAYAIGLCGSRDIEFNCSRDRQLSYLCTGNSPGWNAIRQFRRRHRMALLQSLVHLLASALELTPDPRTSHPEIESRPICARSLCTCKGEWSLHAALATEAEMRLQRAILADSMDMDE